MNTNNRFDLKRLSRLMANDLRLQAKTILIIASTLVVFFALLPFHILGGTTGYFLILYTGGFIISSFAFNELHDRQRAYLALMLPCSNLERFLNKWLLTSVGYAIGVLILYYLFSLLSFVVNRFVFQQPVAIINVTQPGLWVGIGKYIILQSIVLLGAITFKKYALLKTALALGCVLMIASAFSVLIAWMFCPTCFQGETFITTVFRGGYFTFWVIAAPVCWYVTYLRLTEYELK